MLIAAWKQKDDVDMERPQKSHVDIEKLFVVHAFGC